MKKHIWGLLLFGFIVIAAVIVYSCFFLGKESSPPKPSVIKTVTGDATRRADKQLKVQQAVFNLKDKMLFWEIAAPQVNSPVALHFFVQNENSGARYIASEQVLSSALGKDGQSFTAFYPGLDNLKSYKNLYVIAEFVSDSEVYAAGYKPKFDASKATPVTIDYGK